MKSTEQKPDQQTPPRPKFPPRPIPVGLLVTSYHDGYATFRHDGGDEVYLDIHVARVPWAPSGAGSPEEAKAEDVAEALLPLRFRPLWESGSALAAVASTRPLLPSELLAARNAALSIAQLNAVAEVA